MSHLDPFKLRDDMRDSDVLFDVAKKFLGEPSHYSVANNQRVLSWRVMDNFCQHTIAIGLNGGGSLDINWEQEYFGNDNCVSVNLNTFKSDWKGRMFNFIESIKKPWEDWAEGEFLEDPMWIYLFFKANGSVSDSLHSAMTLSSYEDPNNKYVKRYFQEWQSSPPRSSPG
jgi:hypothetical protein